MNSPALRGSESIRDRSCRQSPITTGEREGNAASAARSNYSSGPTSKEIPMPWYAWLILILAIGSIVGGLMMLRDTAKKLPLTEEQLKRIHERNAEMDAKEAKER
jgi:hypothetical protein